MLFPRYKYKIQADIHDLKNYITSTFKFWLVSILLDSVRSSSLLGLINRENSISMGLNILVQNSTCRYKENSREIGLGKGQGKIHNRMELIRDILSVIVCLPTSFG